MKPTTLGNEFRACRAMDRAVDTAAAEQRCIRRIDDRIDGERGDVGNNDLETNGADLGGGQGSKRLGHELHPCEASLSERP